MSKTTTDFDALDSSLFEKLGADLLFARGHTQIRLTGGPGDGGRDIHSIDSVGRPHLAQCKHHKDSDQACSSSDLSELPMAMIKLGYTHGLFITNSRISPQAKREYLNDYPDLNLDFLDGEALAREVLSNGMHTALWYEGTRFADINVSTIFPTIIRRHDGDRPFMPFRLATPPDFSQVLEYLSSRHPAYKFSIRRGRSSSEPFAPYRAPVPLTSEEGATPFLQVIEVSLLGHIAISDFTTVAEDICKAHISWLLPAFNAMSVRVGKPSIVPLEGKNSGERLWLEMSPICFTATQHFCGEERNWFDAKPNSRWTTQSDARVTEAHWIRLYSEELDCCLSYEIHSRISAAARAWEEAMREIQIGGWDRSVFCLLPAWDNWPHLNIPEPDETVRWTWDDRILCGWLHWSILGNPVPIRTGLDPTGESEDDHESRKDLSRIESLLKSVPGATMLHPTKARHMVALAGTDPFPAIGFRNFDTGEVVCYPEILPSPIQPSSRSFALSAVWRCEVDVVKAEEAYLATISESGSPLYSEPSWERWEDYLVLGLELTPGDLELRSTEDLLNEFFDALKPFRSSLTEHLEKYGNVEPATKEYWSKRLNINFGITYEQSDKLYVGTIEADGSITKLDAKTWLEEGFPLTDETTQT
jgi:hypothetical protein